MKWLSDRLVCGWRDALKLASVWLAAIAGALSAVIVANQGLVLSLMAYLPAGFARTLVAVCIGMVVFIVPVVTRLWKQKAPDA